MADSNRQKGALIDVHQHIVPEIFRSLLNGVGIMGGAGGACPVG